MFAKIRWTKLLRQHVLKLDAKWCLISSTRAKCCMILSINRILEKLWEAINLSTSSTCMNLEAVLLLRLFLCQLKSKDYSCLCLHVCMCWSTVVSEVDFAHMLFWMIMMVCVLWSLGLKRNHLSIHQKFFTGPNPNGPLPSKLLHQNRYSELSGFVKRGSVRWRFLGIYMFYSIHLDAVL